MRLEQRKLELGNKRRYSQNRTFTGQWRASVVPSFIHESESCLVASDSLQSHGLYSPWNSLGHNTGVGSLSLLQGIFLTQDLNWGPLHCRWILYQLSYQSQSESRSVVSDSLRPHRSYSPWNSPGQNTGVGGLSLLQGIFPTQGSNRGLLHCRWILYQLSYQGNPL